MLYLRLARLAGWVALWPAVITAQTQSENLDRFPNFDRRAEIAPDVVTGTAAPTQAEASLQAKVKNVKISRDRITGAAAWMASTEAFLTAPGGAGPTVSDQALARFPATDPHRVLKAFLDDQRGIFGHGAEAVTDARLTADYVTAHNGMRTVVWQQQLDGIQVFEALLKAHFSARGELINVGSLFIGNPEAAAQRGTPNRAARVSQPPVSAKTAVAIAARSIGERLADNEVAAEGGVTGDDAVQRFAAPSLLGADARYVWLPLDANTLRLCWQVVCTGRSTSFMFLVLVDAETGEIHVRHTMTEHISNASYRVYPSDSPSPFSPGHLVPSSVQPPLTSRTLVTTAALNPTASPNGWVDDWVMETRGNNVDAHTDTNADNTADTPRPQAVGPDRIFDPPLDLTQDPSTYSSAAVVSLFYWCNFMHDKLYELGFTEAAGNFQINNFGRGGFGNDAVQADAQDGSGFNNANFSTNIDGNAGRMQMYIFNGPTPRRDGDFDAEIICHEYTHGLTNRLVGHGSLISALQARGMGEGWSDFYALCLLSEAGDDPNANYASGGYATYLFGGLTENYYYGIRRYPYSTNLAKNPLTFRDIDPTQASAHSGIPRSPVIGSTANEVHNMGEVWCVTLWEVRANLIAKYGTTAGNQLTLKLVTDGLTLAPANPTYLQARDAILQADLNYTGGANRAELWSAFAKRGMGASAYAPPNSTTTGVVEAFDWGDNLVIATAGNWTPAGDIGGPFSPSSQSYFIYNAGTATMNWTATKTQPWITLSPSSGTFAVGGNATVALSLNANANALPVGTYTDTISFKDTASSQTHTRNVVLTISPPRIMLFALDADPAWGKTGEWQFGPPTGGGSPFRDPTSGATGTNVFGINLAGNYAITLGAAYLTAGPFNLTGYANSRIQFQRWLNTDYQPWVAATVEVSRNGTTWTKIWDNGTSGPMTTSAWSKVQHDMAAIADNQATVYIRWGHQVLRTDAFPYSGWNIDDVEVLGQPGAVPAVITTQPLSQTASIGSTVTFTVAATGLPVPSYQWNFNGVPIAGATTSSLVLPNVQIANAGSYNATVYNSLGTVMSNTVTLTGTASPPSINSQPADILIVSGQNATFSVSASGTPPLAYQWRRNGFVIAGATSSSLTIAGAARRDADYYDVLVGSGLSTAASRVARLSVAPTAYPAVVAADPAWATRLELTTGTGFAVAPLADGRAYIAGSFTQISGSRQTGIARIKADGTLDPTFDPADIDSTIRVVAVQSDDKVLVGGEFLRVNGLPRNRLARLNVDGSVDPTFTATTNGVVTAVAVQGDGRILVGGSFSTVGGTARSCFARLNTDGSVDTTFQTQGFSSQVNAVAVQADGRIVVGGGFGSYYDSVGAATSRSRLARLNPNGTLDAAVAVPSGTVNAIVVQSDGKLVIGGSFATVAGTTAPDIARLKSDGTLDTAFTTAGGTGLNGTVSALALDAVGGIFAGGSFTSMGGVTQNRFVRLNADGSRDINLQTKGFGSTVNGIAVLASGQVVAAGSFVSYLNVNGNGTGRTAFARLAATGTLDAGYNFTGALRSWGTANVFLPLADGKVLVTGVFSTVRGASSAFGLARFNADGSTDTTFAPGSGANSNITAAALQPDGKIVIGGFFTTYGGVSANGLARLNADGTLDPTFNVGAGLAGVNTISILPGGRIFAAGSFTTVNGVAQNRVAVFSANGAVDSSFVTTGASGTVYTSVVQPDGKILICGVFTTYNGSTANRIARLNTSGSLDPTFAVSLGANSDVYSIALQRSGEVIVGGLFSTINGASRPGIARLSSAGVVDTGFIPPTSVGQVYSVLPQEDGRVLLRGQFASVDGAPNTAYLARLNSDGSRDTSFTSGGFFDSSGRPSMLLMRDDGQVFMQTNATATMSVTTAGAPPAITVPPANQSAYYGGVASFSVTTTSALPVTYQWLFNGVAIPAATNSSLALINLQFSNAGSYQVVATNELGSTTSAAATLTVNKLPALVSITNLAQVYDGGPHPVTVSTIPAGLAVTVTYDASSSAPTNSGSYAVVAKVDDPIYGGSATATLEVAKAAAVLALDGLTAVYDGSPKSVSATTTPGGLAINVTYDGNAAPPTNAGTYAVVATVVDANYTGTIAGLLTIAKANATVTLGALAAVYDGTPKPATATTNPLGLAVAISYNSNPVPPANAGIYAVVATIVDANYTGTGTGTLVIGKATAAVSFTGVDATYDGAPKSVTAVTSPSGLTVKITYDGLTTAPTNVGSYAVVGTVESANYTGSGSATLTISPATAAISLSNLFQYYDGTPRAVTVTTTPANRAFSITYNGNADAPTNPGSYSVVATITDPNSNGTSTGTLVIATTVLVRHAPTISGGVGGSVQIVTAENTTIAGNAWISSDLLVRGTPSVVINGTPTYAGIHDGTGAVEPSNYVVTLDGAAAVRQIVRRVDPVSLAAVNAPPTPVGTRDVIITARPEVPEPNAWADVRDIRVVAGDVSVPAGTFGELTVTGAGNVVLGIAGATEPAVYNLQRLAVEANTQLKVAGPIILTIGQDVVITGRAGDPTHPQWLELRVAGSGVTVNGNAELAAQVLVPNGTVTVGNATLTGSVVADALVIEGPGLVDQPR